MCIERDVGGWKGGHATDLSRIKNDYAGVWKKTEPQPPPSSHFNLTRVAPRTILVYTISTLVLTQTYF